MNIDLSILALGLQSDPLPQNFGRDPNIAHAPNHNHGLNESEISLALKNALKYFPKNIHSILKEEFEKELLDYGHIYMYRFKPPKNILKAYHIDKYPAKIKEAAAIMLMISNNLDTEVAQYSEELVTYGGNGQVFSNWAQYWLVMKYLATMNDHQTLAISSGHPMGLFPTNPQYYSPVMVVSNGMVIPNYSSKENYEKLFALGVTLYGQMTAGSYCYIGPQGIVHGTTITITNAIRNQKKLNKALDKDDVKVFVTSGLGGMSGAQAKASVISNCIGVIAEVSETALYKRHKQGWLKEVVTNIPDLIAMIKMKKKNNEPTSIGYLGNVVEVWEALVEHHTKTNELLVDLGSDQTSCHILLEGGYYPAGLTYEESKIMMNEDKTRFKDIIYQSLRRQVMAINYLNQRGMYFFDYGNAFLLEAGRAGADVFDNCKPLSGVVVNHFKFPSYMQDIMGNIFSMGFGPFRWICTSCDEKDLQTSDDIATKVIEGILESDYKNIHENDTHMWDVKQQYIDNLKWIKNCRDYKLVVGSQARILYADVQGRVNIAKAFNTAIKNKEIKCPIILSRDHHDVSGTDSPFRETSNIVDGSAVCADMAIQNVIGDAFRGATWVSIHNGGGVGWGEVINGGFGLVLDGTEAVGQRAQYMLQWDVCNGLTRRMWSGNETAEKAIKNACNKIPNMQVTIPNETNDK